MRARTDHEELFQELERWSQKNDSYSIDAFLVLKGITWQEVSVMASGKNSRYLAFGTALCQCLDNAYRAWKSEKISKEQFSEALTQYGLFQGDAESFDRCKTKLDMVNVQHPEMQAVCLTHRIIGIDFLRDA